MSIPKYPISSLVLPSVSCYAQPMTKKHFEAIAAIFHTQMSNPTIPHESRVTLIATAQMQADYFAAENPRFDRARFLKACGL